MKHRKNCNQVYFDCNATTPVSPQAAQASMNAMQSLYGNPSSSHFVGLQARSILESTRKLAAKAVGGNSDQIIFMSGATEGIQTAVFSALQYWKKQASLPARPKILYGATEHKAVPQAIYHWLKILDLPFEAVELPVDKNGQIRLEKLKELIPDAILICTMAVNNETGIIQDLNVLEALLNQENSKSLWLVDCVQALGKLKLNLNSTRIDFAPFSGHKLYSPKGVGFLYAKNPKALTPLIVGGGQEKGFRSGTENLPGLAAMGVILESLVSDSKESFLNLHSQMIAYRDQIFNELKISFPKLQLNAPFEYAVPTTLNFSVPGFKSNELLDVFDSAGLRVSAGSACTSTSVKPSHVLEAMGLPLENSTSALRLSFGPLTSQEEVDLGCRLIRECSAAFKQTCLLDSPGAFEPPSELNDGVIQLRAGSSNTWLVIDRQSKECVIIDPLETLADRIDHFVRCQKLTVLAILDTHSHADHQSIRPQLQEILADRMKYTERFDSLGWPVSSAAGLTQVLLADGSKVDGIILGSESKDGRLILGRVPTPGHTKDSFAYLLGVEVAGKVEKNKVQFVFPGDTILGGGLGRTDFEISEPESIFYSLRKLQSVLDPECLICPAHDYNNTFATTLRVELSENPLLNLALAPENPVNLQLFLDNKRALDRELKQIEVTFQGMVCGVASNAVSQKGIPESIPNRSAKEFIAKKSSRLLVVDVRESQEFVLFKNWDAIGFQQSPRNIPISRMVNFIRELIELKKTQEPEVLLLCRSGNRSLQATRSLRRLGFTSVWNLEGGLALLQVSI